MRTVAMVVLSVVVLAVLNFAIYAKEQIKANGEVLLLELAPVDPRSLMQGDYMRLRYAIERAAPTADLAAHQKRGHMVIKAGPDTVATFVRFHAGEPLAEGEKLLRFHKQYSQVRIVPDSFFFQEGHAAYYADAQYGVFKFDDAGNHILVGLADADRVAIEPQSSEVPVGR